MRQFGKESKKYDETCLQKIKNSCAWQFAILLPVYYQTAYCVMSTDKADIRIIKFNRRLLLKQVQILSSE